MASSPASPTLYEYRNRDFQWRVWPGLQDDEGHTVALEPGQTVWLREPVEDPYLEPVAPEGPAPAASARKVAPQAAAVPEASDAADADTAPPAPEAS